MAAQEAAIDAFHAHLDKCARCENEPFNLCREGAKLLYATAPKRTISPRVDWDNGIDYGTVEAEPRDKRDSEKK